MDFDKNKHCTESNYACCYHYKGNHACGVNDNPDRIEVFPKSKRYPSFSFEMPRQRHEKDKLLELMGIAYKQGELDRAKAIAATLKSLIAL